MLPASAALQLCMMHRAAIYPLCHLPTPQVETCDGKRGRRYKQTFSKNMTKKGEPVIACAWGCCCGVPSCCGGDCFWPCSGLASPTTPLTSHPPHLPRSALPRSDCGKDENWTCITFYPDLERFGMAELEEETVQLMRKRVYDMAGILGKTVKVGGRQGWLGGWSLAGGPADQMFAQRRSDSSAGQGLHLALGFLLWLLAALCAAAGGDAPSQLLKLHLFPARHAGVPERHPAQGEDVPGVCGGESAGAGWHAGTVRSAALRANTNTSCRVLAWWGEWLPVALGMIATLPLSPLASPQMYLGPKESGVPRVYERFSDRWEVCVATTEGQFNQVGGCGLQRGWLTCGQVEAKLCTLWQGAHAP